MKRIDTQRVNFALEYDDDPEALLRATEAALSDAEHALANAVLDMAEASCKGVPKSNERLQAVLLAREATVDNLRNLRKTLRFKIAKCMKLEQRKEHV